MNTYHKKDPIFKVKIENIRELREKCYDKIFDVEKIPQKKHSFLLDISGGLWKEPVMLSDWNPIKYKTFLEDIKNNKDSNYEFVYNSSCPSCWIYRSGWLFITIWGNGLLLVA